MIIINSLERDGLRQAELCPRNTMMMNTNSTLIPDRSQPGITVTTPTVRQRDVGDKYATGVPKIKKIRGRENISVGTWNVSTLRPAGKLEQLTHAMSRYHWNIVGLCEMRLKNFGEMSTDDRHKVYYAPNFGEVEGAYWFWPVRPSVRPSVCPSVRLSVTCWQLRNSRTPYAGILKLYMWHVHEK